MEMIYKADSSDSEENIELPKTGSYFCPSWLQHPKYRLWIGHGSSMKKVYCSYCGIEFAANRGSLLKHYRSIKHEECAKIANNLHVIDVRRESDVPHNSLEIKLISKAYGDYAAADGLECTVAGLVGQEKGLLFPTHTMANLVAALAHCQSRDAPVILGNTSQMMKENREAMIKFGGIQLLPRPCMLDGSFELPRVHDYKPEVEPPGLVCIECAHFNCGGTVPTVHWMKQVTDYCEIYGFKCHCDGTRLLQAAVSKDLSPADLTKGFNSVTLSIVKGLGAPTGAVLCGNRAFIKVAKSIRDEMGGDISQPGMITTVAMRNLHSYRLILRRTHETAVTIGQKLSVINSLIFNIEVVGIETNVLRLQFDSSQCNTEQIVESLATRVQDNPNDSSILTTRINDSCIAMEIHTKVTNVHVARICNKIFSVLGLASLND